MTATTSHNPPTHQHAITPEGGWTMQAYFDEAVRYLASMKHRCADGTVCFYRRGANACVIGHFISDQQAKELGISLEWGGNGGVNVLARYPALEGVAFPAGEQGVLLARRLQSVHDRSHKWDSSGFVGWADIQLIADEHGLTLNYPETQVK